MVLKKVTGQERIIEKLKKALKNDQIAHAYLFEGAKGLGKENLAIWLASALVCDGSGQNPCGKCNSCAEVSDNSHPDVKMIKEDRIIGIDQIRKLIGEIQLKPYKGNRKVYIICDADKMNRDSQNALLKTLEEPPLYATLILLTSKGESLLPTIISRCQTIKLYPVDPEIIKNYLIENKKVDKEQAHMLAVFSGGIIGRALELLDNPDFYYRREEVIETCNRLAAPDLFSVLERISFFEENRSYIDEIFDLMMGWYRDLFVYSETKNVGLVTNIDKKDEICLQASNIDLSKTEDIIFIIEKAKQNLRGNVRFHLNIEVMLLNIQEVLLNGDSGRGEIQEGGKNILF